MPAQFAALPVMSCYKSNALGLRGVVGFKCATTPKSACCYYFTASSCGTVEFPTAYSLILPLVACHVVVRDLLRLAPAFLFGLRSVSRAAYVGCQLDYKHVELLIVNYALGM